MAKSTVVQGRRKTNEKPVSKEIARGAERAGIQSPRLPETREERTARLKLQREALTSDERDSLRSRIIRSLTGGAFVATETTSSSPDRALIRFAAATAKATGLALRAEDYVCANESFDVTFDSADAAVVLLGLAGLLEEAPELLTAIDIADHAAGRSLGRSEP